MHRLPPLDGRPRTVESRNLLLWYYPGAVGVKTGYLPRRATVWWPRRIGTKPARDRRARPSRHRVRDGALLLDYGYRGFDRSTVIRIRQQVGVVRPDGAAVQAVAGGELSALVALRPPGRVETKLIARPRLRGDLRPGDRVGRVEAIVDGRVVGSVPPSRARRRCRAGGSPTASPPGVAAVPWDGVLRPLGILAAMLREVTGAFL